MTGVVLPNSWPYASSFCTQMIDHDELCSGYLALPITPSTYQSKSPILPPSQDSPALIRITPVLSVTGPVKGLKPFAILSAAAVTRSRTSGGTERCHRHHPFAETLPHHRGLEGAGDYAACGRGHEWPPGETKAGKPALRCQLPRLDGLKADRIGPATFGCLMAVAGSLWVMKTTPNPSSRSCARVLNRPSLLLRCQHLRGLIENKHAGIPQEVA